MTDDARIPLGVAATVVALEALAFIALAVADLTGLVSDRVGLGIGIAVVLLMMGVGLVIAAVGLLRRSHTARGPIVVTQLIALGLAWSLRHPDPNTGDNRAVAVTLAVAAAVVLGCLATGPARRALADDPGA